MIVDMKKLLLVLILVFFLLPMFTSAACDVEGDINGDYSVTIDDLILVAIDFGKTSGFFYRVDTDNNTVIDIFDVVYVASRFGSLFTCPSSISLRSNPSSGSTNTTVNIPILVNNTNQSITAYGLDITYNNTMLQYQSFNKGNLTIDWFTVDGNEISPGNVSAGGFAGAGTPVPLNSRGSIAIASFVVNCTGCSSGQQSQICIHSYVDDIANITPEPSCTQFTFNSSPTPPNSISLLPNPSSGSTNTIVNVSISVDNNEQVITAFGLDIAYNNTMLQYQSFTRVNLTSDWFAVDGNEISPGNVRAGGFAGAGSPVPLNSTGSIAIASFNVTCLGCSSGQQSQICIHSYVDHIENMTPEPSCTQFTFN